MKLVIDANVIISALITDSKTRELIVTLEPDLVTPEIIQDEIEKYDDPIGETSGIDGDRVQQSMELLIGLHRNRSTYRFLPAHQKS